MQKTATVAVINNNRLLILRRGQTAPWMPGKYCLPGGKVEGDEGLTYCASRELSEEAGISMPVDSWIPVTIDYTNYSKTVFVGQIDSDKVVLNYEHDMYAWISTKEIEQYDLVPGLHKTISTLINKGYIYETK